MRDRNIVTGAVINSPCMISGKNWQELSPAGFPLNKGEKEEVQEEVKEEPVKTEEPEEEPKKEAKKADTKKSGGAVIRPKKGK